MAGHSLGQIVIKRLVSASDKLIMKCCQSYHVCRFLEPQYRRPLILQELLGFHADVICLQEVDEKAFAEYFLPQLQQAGTVGSSWPTCILCLLMSCLLMSCLLMARMHFLLAHVMMRHS